MPRPPVTSTHQGLTTPAAMEGKGLHLMAAMPTHTKQKETTGHTSGHFMQAGYSEERAPCSGPPPTAAASQRPASRQAQSRPAGASERHPHFSCSSAGMLMFQPMACRSKPQVNRLHTGWSSLQAEPHTIRRWPCNQAQRRQSRAQAGPHTPPRPVRKGALNWTSQETSCAAGGAAAKQGVGTQLSSVQPNQRLRTLSPRTGVRWQSTGRMQKRSLWDVLMNK